MEWTELMLTELRQRWAAGEKVSQIGSAIGVSKNAVVGKAHRLHLPARPSPIARFVAQDKRDEIDRLLQAGMVASQIAASADVSEDYVRRRADRILLQKPVATLAALGSQPPRRETKPAVASASPRIDNVPATKAKTAPSTARAKRAEPSQPLTQFAPVPVSAIAATSALSGSAPQRREITPQPARPAPIPTAILGSQGCCWPMWGFRENPTHVYCDAPRSDPAKPYCAKHCAGAFVKINRLVAA